MESRTLDLQIGDKAQVISTGHWVNIEQISGHGIAVVSYGDGYRRMVMLKDLSKTPVSLRETSAA